MKSISLLLVLSLLGLLASCSTAEPTPMAFVSVAENARVGGMQIIRIDGEPVAEANGFDLTAGAHEMSVACRLDNGIRTSFNFAVDLLPNHSYCFYSRDQGKSCTILYTQIAWKGGGAVTCR